MSKRSYEFDIPVHINGFYAGFVPSKLAEANLWNPLPNSVQDKMNDAATHGTELVLTKEDLDSIDDHTWSGILALVKPFV